MLNRLFLPFLAFLLGILGTLDAQILKPVEWNYEVEKKGPKLYELRLIANIDSGWHIYGQEIDGEGPIPTSFKFQKEENFKLIGKVKPLTKGKFKHDKMYGAKFTTFSGKTIFAQKVEIKDEGQVDRISGELTFMTCKEDKCLSPTTKNFTFNLNEAQRNEEKGANTNKSGGGWQSVSKDEGSEPSKTEDQKNQILDPVNWNYKLEHVQDNVFELSLKANIDKGWRIYGRDLDEGGPEATSFDFKEDDQDLTIKGKTEPVTEPVTKYDSVFQMELTYFEESAHFAQKIKLLDKVKSFDAKVRFMACDDSRCLPPKNKTVEITLSEDQIAEVKQLESADKGSDQKTMWGIFIAGFAGGLLAFLTPCVFPMVPLTVSFFTKSSGNKSKGVLNAIVYGLSIILIYVLLGFLVTKLFGSSALNQLASNIWFNLAFFFIFILFAISFFGAFEITLPSSWVNRSDRVADRGGFVGIFFMAFTLGLVSFSCTGPIIGTLLVQAAVVGSNTGPLIGMFGFSLALALPFTIFAAFPGWLNSMPKSGGWLNTVKVVLGFLELGLALKFLSNVDMAYSWGILPREVFLGVWILIGLGLIAYLVGLIKFPHDSPGKKLTFPRLGLSLVVLLFVGYLARGMGGQPLQLLSGFPPPTFYSVWESKNCPQDFNCFHDYDKGLAYAKKVNKPIMLDFTGWSCVNCRKMEENVWVDPEIKKLIGDRYVLVSLYVDEKEKLPESERYVSDFSGKKINTVGKKWSDFQASRFKANSQPYYVLLNTEEQKLIEPKGYTPNPEEYEKFLKKGLKEFKEQNKQAFR